MNFIVALSNHNSSSNLISMVNALVPGLPMYYLVTPPLIPYYYCLDVSSFMWVADRNRGLLYQVIIDSDSKHIRIPVTMENTTEADILACDPVTRNVYITSGFGIYMYDFLKGYSTRIVKTLGTINSLAVDHVCKKLYWSLFYGNEIMVSNLDGTQVTELIQVEYPRATSLDIKSG